MTSFVPNPQSTEPPQKNKTIRNSVIAGAGLLLGYFLYHQYIQAQLQVSQMQMNTEEIKTINTDMGRLREDIQDNRDVIQDKQRKIDELKQQIKQ